MYDVGARVVHPCYGAGTVVRIRRKAIGDPEHVYYVIDSASGQMRFMVPVSRAQEAGLRSVSSERNLRRVLRICTVAPNPDSIESDYRRRKAEFGEALKSGSYETVVDVVRKLFFRSKGRTLGGMDRAMLNRGKELLASELALACESCMDDAMREVEDLLAEMMATDLDEA